MSCLVIVRHGESQWNLEQRFTGWADVDLTPRGVAQMERAGKRLRQHGIELNEAYSSTLTRSIRSLWILLDAIGTLWIPVRIDWRLNERHYGALTGQSKMQAEKEYGAALVQRWRRAYDAEPPPISGESGVFVKLDRRYAGLPASTIPTGESLLQTVARVSETWRESIAPALRMGQSVLVVAHGNSLRALTKIIEGTADADIGRLEIANGEPRVYEFDSALTLIDKRVLSQSLQSASDIL